MREFTFEKQQEISVAIHIKIIIEVNNKKKKKEKCFVVQANIFLLFIRNYALSLFVATITVNCMLDSYFILNTISFYISYQIEVIC